MIVLLMKRKIRIVKYSRIYSYIYDYVSLECLHSQLIVVAFLCRRQLLELRQAGMYAMVIVTMLTPAPAGIDLVQGPHFVYILGQLLLNLIH